MFGNTVAELIIYLGHVTQDQLDDVGYTATVLQDLLDEKAKQVFSYLPAHYSLFWRDRVYRLIVIDYAKDGQTTAVSPIFCNASSNFVAYKNPTYSLDDLDTAEEVSISYGSPNLIFPALERGDKIIVDYTPQVTDTRIEALAIATKILSAIDILSVTSGDSTTGKLNQRAESDIERIHAWLEALANGNRIVYELEYKFFEGDFDTNADISRITRKNARGLS